MKLEKVKMDSLVSPEWNPRVISDNELEKLKNSLKEFDYVDPILVNKVNNHIVGGNQRYHALKELGYTEIEVVFINEPNIHKEKALNIALNKISGEWDYIKLNTILDDLLDDDSFDIKLTGFDNLDLESLDVDLDEFDDLLFDDGFDDNQNNNNTGGNGYCSMQIDCKDNEELNKLYSMLNDEGYKVRIK